MAQRQIPSLQTTFRRLNPSLIGGMVPTEAAATDVFFATLHRIEAGMVTLTAAGMNGVLET